MWHRSLYLFFAFISLSAATFASESEPRELCPGILLQSKKIIRFSSLELKFICGSDGSEAWERIPLKQLRLHVKAMLQTRGYHQPTIERVGKQILIQAGPQRLVDSVIVRGTPEGMEIPSFQNPVSKPLSPQSLDLSKNWALNQLARRSYPCATADAIGDIETGIIYLDLEPKQKLKLTNILEPELSGVDSKVFERYWAFELGDFYDARKIEITNRRINVDGVAEASQFRPLCKDSENAEVSAQHSVLAGSPRLFGIGIGASTEEYAVFRTSWKASRLGRQASSVNIDLRASFREQRFTTEAEWYTWPNRPRFFLLPGLEVRRESERPYTALHSSGYVLPSSSLDTGNLRLDWSLGPKFTDTRVLAGVGPNSAQFVSLYGSLSLMNHEFEFNRFQPRDGWSLSFVFQGLNRKIYSPISLIKTSVGFDFLYSVGPWDPKALIIGLRNLFNTSFIPATQDPEQIPVEFRNFLGGSNDLRGFGRKALPRDEQGAISSVTSSIELRSELLFSPKLDPFIFFDVGLLGEDSFEFDTPVYTSPGIGLRWQSPIGVLRASIAHGIVFAHSEPDLDKLETYQFNISLGEEF